MAKINCLNPIAACGMDLFNDTYEVVDDFAAADAVLVRSAAMHDLELSDNLLAIARAGAGVNNIPLDKCAEKGIVVFNTPGANANGVKELVIAGLLLASRDLMGGYNWVKENASDENIAKTVEKQKKHYAGCEIMGKKLGVIGLGAIGAKVAAICKGIGMETAGFSHSKNRAKVEAAGCEYYENMDDLLRDCDFITIHNPLTPETTNMISSRELHLMKKSAILINTSRGPIVNEKDLADALNNDVIAAAGIDVFSEEPAVLDNPVFHCKNTIVTPHLAALTKEAKARMHVNSVKGCLAILNGTEWPDVVDKSVYKK